MLMTGSLISYSNSHVFQLSSFPGQGRQVAARNFVQRADGLDHQSFGEMVEQAVLQLGNDAAVQMGGVPALTMIPNLTGVQLHLPLRMPTTHCRSLQVIRCSI